MASLIFIKSVVILSFYFMVHAGVINRDLTSLDGFRKSRIREGPIRGIPWHVPIKPPGDPLPPQDPPASQKSKLDLAFIMDSTGSMSPYIDNVRQHVRDLVDAIVASSSTNLRLALIEYRDHKPEDFTFVTRKHDFTSSVFTMKSWLNAARASGGGDRPEAVAEAMNDATTLSWRRDSAKIAILISDAPPHGLVPREDNSFPDGSPNGHDPIRLARTLARKGITLYTVGCEPSIVPYKDFFMALAYLTGGQYIPLSVPHFLTDAIIGGAKEELSLQKFSSDVQKEIEKVTSAGGTVNEAQIAQSVFNKLKSKGAKATQLLRNNKPLEGASAAAKAIAASSSMVEVRKIFKKGPESRPSGDRSGLIGSKVFPKFDIGRRFESVPSRRGGSKITSGIRKSSVGTSSAATAAAAASAAAGESFAAVDSAVSLDQIKRLVKQERAKLAV